MTPLRWLLIPLVVVAIGVIYWIIQNQGLADFLADINRLILWIGASGAYGPLLIIAAMTVAVVFNPLPSAPIALAAGAVFGHTLGTVYIVCGALLGAIIAFLIARFAGREAVSRLVSQSGMTLGRFGSQNALTAYVFVSRLIPFISFDLVSYAAGLTNLMFWRFVIATLFGLIPSSFLLAHFGWEMAEADFGDLQWMLLIAGVITLPLVLFKLNQYYQETAAKNRSRGNKMIDSELNNRESRND